MGALEGLISKRGITQRITVPVSTGLLSEVDGYYEALTAYRSGYLEPIVTAFSGAAFAAISNGEELVRELAEIREVWVGRVKARAGAAVWLALPLVLSQPAVTVNHLAAALNVFKPTAKTAIEHMVAGDVLVPANSFRRNRVWVAGKFSTPWTDLRRGPGVAASPRAEGYPVALASQSDLRRSAPGRSLRFPSGSSRTAHA